MKPAKHIAFPAMILWLALLAACTPPAAPAPALGVDDLNTIIAQTAIRAQTQSAVPGNSSAVGTAASTFTQAAARSTPTGTLSPTALSTFTPGFPQITVSVDTNCRNGPGKEYEYRGALLAGMTTEVIAGDPSGKYWFIRNPDSDLDFCWVWGGYATLTGDFAALPVYTPLPSPSPTITPTPTYTLTPVPAIKANFSKMEVCSGKWWVNIKIKNIGAVSFKSYDITVIDRNTDVTQLYHADVFRNIQGCSVPILKYGIAAGETITMSTPSFAKNLSDHDVRIILTLCAGLRQTGQCLTERFSVKP